MNADHLYKVRTANIRNPCTTIIFYQNIEIRYEHICIRQGFVTTDSFVAAESFVLRMNTCAERSRHRY